MTTFLSIRCVVTRLSIKHLANACRGGTYMVKPIVHGGDHHRSMQILPKCCRAMYPGGKLLGNHIPKCGEVFVVARVRQQAHNRAMHLPMQRTRRAKRQAIRPERWLMFDLRSSATSHRNRWVILRRCVAKPYLLPMECLSLSSSMCRLRLKKRNVLLRWQKVSVVGKAKVNSSR